MIIVWFRKDLRLSDNPALYAAAKKGVVLPLYILDETLGAASKWWLHHSLLALEESGVPLILRSGDPEKILAQLLKETKAEAIYWNRCYEPESIKRDIQLKKKFPVESFNGSLLHEPWEILNDSEEFYKVYTHYWKKSLKLDKIEKPLPKPQVRWAKGVRTEKLSSWKLLPTHPNWASKFDSFWEIGEEAAQKKLRSFISTSLKAYGHDRDFPAIVGTSRLSPHLHFGEISPRQIWHAAPHASKFLSEIGWREFSYYLLYHFPKLPTAPFRPEFAKFPWKKNGKALKAWHQGKTGYPIVDAGMRELWSTGWMHNRVRMIVASFLIKDLLQPWQEGAAWFWDTLVDADLANNSASWQWVAGSGADAAPFFRIFNPVLQGKKFDPDGTYIKRWVPELAKVPPKWIHEIWEAPEEIQALAKNYPSPIVDHEEARKIALMAFQKL